MRTSMVQNNGISNSKPNFKGVSATPKFQNKLFLNAEYFDKGYKHVVDEAPAGFEALYTRGAEILEELKTIFSGKKGNMHIDQVNDSTLLTFKKGLFSKKIEDTMLENVEGKSRLIPINTDTLTVKLIKMSEPEGSKTFQ